MRRIPQLPDLMVLHIEQSSYTRRLARQMLLRVGLQRIAEASDGVEALATMRAYAPDLILLDWDLPRPGGEEVLRRVRMPGLSHAPEVPVVVTMAVPTHAKVMAAAGLGANAVLAKPFSPWALWSHLEGAIGSVAALVPGASPLPSERAGAASPASPPA